MPSLSLRSDQPLPVNSSSLCTQLGMEYPFGQCRPSVEKKKKKKMKYLFLIFLMNLLHQYAGKSLRRDGRSLKSFEDIKNEIAGYTNIAKAIIDLAVHGKAQNRSYERLAVFADTIGPRLSGSKNLEAAIKYMFTALQKDGLENVHLEPVKVPHWERGEEFAEMLEPRNHSIAILGLGNSIATPPEGITAEVIVVASFDELHKRAQEAKGKIVVYNEPFISYGETVQYRLQGAVEAAKVGAVASLIRSIASFSIHRSLLAVMGVLVRQAQRADLDWELDLDRPICLPTIPSLSCSLSRTGRAPSDARHKA
ncbi:hypothetical protein DUI87_07309 [Hirundo rustica rustica]|uniref:Carboxypeptidase Q n=1 Tax=Hirundo rustica rustica TaxID=333673 RepID=A0A3M0L7F5_HIRRU|nr:hypothetical protein DUI87_07309 [Hirundo rustica rustica]